MDQTADFRIESTPAGDVLTLTGDWTARSLARVANKLDGGARRTEVSRLNLDGLGRFDTAGAYLLATRAGVAAEPEGAQARPDVQRLLKLVQAGTAEARVRRKPHPSIYSLLVRAGRGVARFGQEGYETFMFYGHLLVAIGRILINPRKFRMAPTFALMERAGLDAMPIVAVTTFFIGATVGFLGANLLSQFGAQVFSVELIGIAVMREFAVLITAVLLAGRSASSFAAEIGAMKMNQEVDAMSTMGVDPFESLVVPRFVALLTMMPLLTFVAALAGLFGGLVVTWTVLNLSPAFFIQRLLDNVGPRHFYLGIIKAPVMAMVIAAIGCRQGMDVGGDVEVLGRRVTSAVVQAIFMIIVIDAAFALVFMELGQ